MHITNRQIAYNFKKLIILQLQNNKQGYIKLIKK